SRQSRQSRNLFKTWCVSKLRPLVIPYLPEKKLMSTMQNNRRVYIPLNTVSLVLLLSAIASAQNTWPQFRGPESNPVGTHAKLAERWSKTEHGEWFQESPGS